LLAAGEGGVGGLLNSHDCLIAGDRVWHHSCVSLLLVQVLARRAVIGQRSDGGSIVMLLLAIALGIVGWCTVTCSHLRHRLLDVGVLLDKRLVHGVPGVSCGAWRVAGVGVVGVCAGVGGGWSQSRVSREPPLEPPRRSSEHIASHLLQGRPVDDHG
jgi:hypothetical protein